MRSSPAPRGVTRWNAFDPQKKTSDPGRMAMASSRIGRALCSRNSWTWCNESILGEELLLRREDGEIVSVLVSAAPIRTLAGEVTGVPMILRDISHVRELEDRKKEAAG